MSSKCPKCEKTSFETVIESPRDSNFKVQFIRCSHCKTVVGVLDYYNISSLIFKLAKKLNIDNLDS